MHAYANIFDRKVKNHFDKNNTSAETNILSAQYVYDLVLERDFFAFFFVLWNTFYWLRRTLEYWHRVQLNFHVFLIFTLSH